MSYLSYNLAFKIAKLSLSNNDNGFMYMIISQFFDCNCELDCPDLLFLGLHSYSYR
jgi:hypothetical protein